MKHDILKKEKAMLDGQRAAKKTECARKKDDYDRAALELEELDEIVAEKARLITEELAKPKQN